MKKKIAMLLAVAMIVPTLVACSSGGSSETPELGETPSGEEEVVIDFIKSQRGIKFDPELCDLFIKHKDEIHQSCVGLEDPDPSDKGTC